MGCNVNTRRAQLLVPVENLVQAQQAFKEYKERISTFNQREADFTTLVQAATPPQAIYVPTAKVHNNLSLIQKRSAYQVWEQVPDAVRSPANIPPTGYRPPTMAQQVQPPPPKSTHPLFPNATAGPPKEVLKVPPAIDEFPPLKSDKTHDVTQDHDYSGDETATTQSQMTKSLATTQNKFTEMEAAIRKHQAALTDHKKEIAIVNNRTLTTLELVQQTSVDVLQLQEATTERFNELKAATEADARERREEFALMKAMIASLTQTQLASSATTHSSDASATSTGSPDSDSEHFYGGSDNMSTQTVETDNQTPATSPRKQRDKRKDRDNGLESIRRNINQQPPHDQDKSAQYKSHSTPGAGTT